MSVFHGITRPDIPRIPQDLATKGYIDFRERVNQLIIKTADETINNDAVLHNDTELFFTVEANSTYNWMLMWYYITENAADIQFNYSIPAGATGFRNNGNWNGTADSTTPDMTVATNINTLFAEKITQQVGRIIVGGTAGTVNFQWAQQTQNASNSITRQGSMLVVWKVP